MANVMLKGEDAIEAARQLVRGMGFYGFDLEPDVPETARIIAPFVDTPENLTLVIAKARNAGWITAVNFQVREDVPPADSAGGVVGTPIE